MLDVLIAGAGPGGLTAALALKQKGISCRIVERAKRDRLCADVGGSYHIGSTTLAMLDQLGVGAPCRAAGVRFQQFNVYTETGRLLMAMPIPSTIDMVTMRRSALQAALLEAVSEDLLRCDTGVVCYEQDNDGVLVELSSGEQIRAGLLIGADGVHSKVREKLVGDGPPHFCGLTCCWGRISKDQLSKNFALKDAYSQMGLGASTAVARIGDEIVWSVFWRTPSFQASVNTEQRKARVLARFTNWPGPTPEIIAATPPEIIAEVGILDRDPCASWYHGRVVLIGDAAHPMTPFLGQGANSAMLDAYVLVHYLGNRPYQSAFAAYQQKRKPLTDKNVRKARLICDYSTPDRRWKQMAMSSLMRIMPNSWTLRTMLRADLLNDVSDLFSAC